MSGSQIVWSNPTRHYLWKRNRISYACFSVQVSWIWGLDKGIIICSQIDASLSFTLFKGLNFIQITVSRPLCCNWWSCSRVCLNPWQLPITLEERSMVLQSEDEEKLGYEGFPIDFMTLYDIYTKSLHQAHMQCPWIHSRQPVMKSWTPCKILKPTCAWKHQQ